jgi:hypothetical protein
MIARQTDSLAIVFAPAVTDTDYATLRAYRWAATALKEKSDKAGHRFYGRDLGMISPSGQNGLSRNVFPPRFGMLGLDGAART